MRVRISVLAFTLILVLAIGASALAADDPVGTAAMMDIGMGARALGMGGAHIAVADDAAAIYYNPAGLAFLTERHIGSLYTQQCQAAGYMAAAYSQRYVGVGALRLDASGIAATDEFANETGVFDVVDFTIIAGGGVAVLPQLGIGGAVKYYSQTLPDNSGRGFTGDVGLLYATPNNKLRIGAVARNVAGELKYESEYTDAFDLYVGAGIALYPMENLLIAADVIYKDAIEGRVGGEYELGRIRLRAGGAFGAGRTSVTAGAGFAVSVFSIDYAYQTHNVLPDSHRLSLGVKF
ncbi:MAG: PorV/PorQ family protein [Firmicutes bacterium]|nr:PorV/PorQ family protein [Bacillota bacterium]MDD4337537.1 PorV/PorQ family protein [Bacillota bacterium]